MKNRRPLIIAAVIILVIVLVAIVVFVATRPKSEPTVTASPTASALTASPSSQASGVAPSPSASPSSPAASPSASPATTAFFDAVPADLVAKAKADLPGLPIKPGLSQAGYTRAQFGTAWTDSCTTTGCGNHCDTRDDILARDLVEEILKSDGCTVVTGILHDAYTGKTIMFTRGVNTSGQVQIDHIVPLGDAWRTGAQNLSKAERTNLANNPLNLVAVDGPTNGAKSDSDAADWLPPQTAAYCAYVVHQVEVKVTYHLWVTQAEHDAIVRVLAGC